MSYDRRGWPKKSKLVMEEGVTVGSTIENDFNKADGSCSDVIGGGLDGFDSNIDGDEEQKL